MLYTSILIVGLGSASDAKSGLGHVIIARKLRMTRDLHESLKYRWVRPSSRSQV